MVEKIRLEEDLRIATMEKKRLSDSERILLNTFDTLKKYYDTKDNQTENADKNEGDDDCENLKCNQFISKSTSRRMMNKHIAKVHVAEILKCSKCDFECETRDQLNTHISRIHKMDKHIKCRKYNYEAKTEKELRFHIADDHDVDIRQTGEQNKNMKTL